jgi:hypothetical protein
MCYNYTGVQVQVLWLLLLAYVRCHLTHHDYSLVSVVPRLCAYARQQEMHSQPKKPEVCQVGTITIIQAP